MLYFYDCVNQLIQSQAVYFLQRHLANSSEANTNESLLNTHCNHLKIGQ